MTPIIWLYENGYLEGRVLYVDCGYFSDLDYLRAKGVDITPLDSLYHRDRVEGKYDLTIGHNNELTDINIITYENKWEIYLGGIMIKESKVGFTFIIFSFVALALALGAMYTVAIYNNMPKLSNVDFCNSLFVRQVDRLICIESLTKKGE